MKRQTDGKTERSATGNRNLYEGLVYVTMKSEESLNLLPVVWDSRKDGCLVPA